MRLTALCIEGRGLCAPVVGNLLAEGESATFRRLLIDNKENIKSNE